MYQYKVQGRGYFPADMLRYDCAKVVEISDADVLKTFDEIESENGFNTAFAVYEIEWTATLVSKYPPTTRRWASFGAVVSSIEKVSRKEQ